MRSRYSAFVRADAAYLEATGEAPPGTGDAEALTGWARSVTWLGLTVHEVAATSDPDEGFVAFTARYLEGASVIALAERSRFVRRAGRWLYVAGEPTLTRVKVAPNERCPCGSGRKFKQCHG